MATWASAPLHCEDCVWWFLSPRLGCRAWKLYKGVGGCAQRLYAWAVCPGALCLCGLVSR